MVSDAIWHPYLQMKKASQPLMIERASGCYIFTEDGRKILDGISSWWTAVHGHNHPYIRERMVKQLEKFAHFMFTAANRPAYALADKLVEFMPAGFNHHYIVESGSIAIEVALKMAVQYFANIGQAKKHRFISFSNSYHGESMGALSVGDPDELYAQAFKQYFPQQYHVKMPESDDDLHEFAKNIAQNKDCIAALVIEPMVQAAYGMKFHSSELLSKICKIAKNNDILVICDEIATGFYRTGQKFAVMYVENLDVDIMTIGKALTSGMSPLAVVCAADKIWNRFYSDDLTKAFMHGTTYCGYALGCSAAVASIELFEQEDYQEKASGIAAIMLQNLQKLKKFAIVGDVRVIGGFGVIELKNTSCEILKYLRQRFLDLDLWIRPISNVIYLAPPLIIERQDLERLCDGIYEVISTWQQNDYKI